MNVGHEAAAMGERSADDVLRLTVRLHGLALGRPVDLLLDRDDLRVVGVDVLCGDQEHRFLPLAAAKLAGDTISIGSPLVLLEEDELEFYRARTFSLASLRRRPVRRHDRELGLFRDLRLNADFTVAAVVLEADGREHTVAFDDSLRIEPRSRSAA